MVGFFFVFLSVLTILAKILFIFASFFERNELITNNLITNLNHFKMKKLALALMCLVSVAFFASCTKPVENPEPSIAVVTGDNYIYDGQTIDLGVDYNLGFRAASNSQTMKELAKFQLQTKFYEAGDEESSRPEVVADTTVTLSGTEYVYQEVVNFVQAKAGIIGKIEFTAIVTDVDGKSNTKTITVNLNQAEDPLAVSDFEWFRQGNQQSGLEEYGLYWDRNAKSPFAEIKPLPGVILYKFENSSVWDEVQFPSQKEAVFSDGAVTASMYNNVDVNQNGTYDDVIGTRMTDGTYHLIHVEMCRIGTYTSQGTPITIYGKSK